MKNYLPTTILLFSLAACRPVKEIPVATETVIRERVVPVTVPADSAAINMSFDCDSVYGLVLKYYEEWKTAGVETSFKQSGNNIGIAFKTKTDTLFVVATDTITTMEKPVVVEIEKKGRGSVLTKILWLVFAITAMICGTRVISIFKKK